MRALRFLNLAIHTILVASSAVLYAQEEKQEEKPPRQEEPKAQEPGKPASKQDEMKPPKQEEPKGQEPGKPAARQDEMKPPKQEEAKPEKPSKQEQKEEKQSREQMNNGRQEPLPQQEGHARPAGKGGHIPDDKFRADFGRGHVFKVQRPVAVEGGQGFVYGGYSFVLVDTWPPDWAYTDDCYVDYIDGEYWLFDMLHPGVRLELMVVM